jgi:beta-apo-4'-carotenal oxygenase
VDRGCDLAGTRLTCSRIADNEAAIVEAFKRDLGKPRFEAYTGEIDWCKNEIIYVCKNLAKWMKDEPAPDMSLTNRLASPKIRKDPLGAVLILGAYNFPVSGGWAEEYRIEAHSP